ncbi:MAG TPA: glycoside hydrolase family 19 protein [Vicinamibacterales bacterium]|nr:glycoside hydrolase family 19 protein [Vicinamibacterales bacterium]
MPDILTPAQLTTFLPGLADAASWTAALNAAMDRFEIDTPQRGAAFLAQIAHESGEFRRLVENLNYSAARLCAVWPSRFATPDAAKPYERNPEALANYVYAKRLGNGDVPSGDGWRFRGRGLIQLTGRGNYRSSGVAVALPFEAEPERLETADAAALAAAQFWQSRGLNHLADDSNDDNDDEDFVSITKIINGGTAGLTSRRTYWARAKAALGIIQAAATA